jgi:hypothetical protein
MPEEILKFTKIIFVFQAITGIAFGLTFLLFGEQFLIMESWPFNYEPVFIRLLGIDFIGIAVLMLLSSREKEWAKVKNVVIMVIFWTIFNSIVFTILHFVYNLPLINWTNIGSYMIFAVLYIIVFIKQQK